MQRTIIAFSLPAAVGTGYCQARQELLVAQEQGLASLAAQVSEARVQRDEISMS